MKIDIYDSEQFQIKYERRVDVCKYLSYHTPLYSLESKQMMFSEKEEMLFEKCFPIFVESGERYIPFISPFYFNFCPGNITYTIPPSVALDIYCGM